MISNITRHGQDQQHLLSTELPGWVEEDSQERFVSDTIDHLDAEDRLAPFYPEEIDKPLWIRDHSCPAYGLESEWGAKVAWNVLSRGLVDLRVDHSEDTPVETSLRVDTASVSAQRVVEPGSSCPTERASASE